jgi:hypothetical protein
MSVCRRDAGKILKHYNANNRRTRKTITNLNMYIKLKTEDFPCNNRRKCNCRNLGIENGYAVNEYIIFSHREMKISKNIILA